MAISFTNQAQELAYQKVADYLASSLFKHSMRVRTDMPRFDLLYNGSTLIEVDVLPWEVHPWNDSELATVRAASQITVGNTSMAAVTHFLLAENRKMRFGAFQLDESGQVVFADSILGGDNLDLLELQTCILSVAAIANSYSDIIAQQFDGAEMAIAS
ncbi:MAG: hypothetical protein SFY66_07070 [Oculatellaceae cyanobacterium bins.114]|nr:hypothetical protein [Oculatellaceae cyanobacterium bins.114]